MIEEYVENQGKFCPFEGNFEVDLEWHYLLLKWLLPAAPAAYDSFLVLSLFILYFWTNRPLKGTWAGGTAWAVDVQLTALPRRLIIFSLHPKRKKNIDFIRWNKAIVNFIIEKIEIEKANDRLVVTQLKQWIEISMKKQNSMSIDPTNIFSNYYTFFFHFTFNVFCRWSLEIDLFARN